MSGPVPFAVEDASVGRARQNVEVERQIHAHPEARILRGPAPRTLAVLARAALALVVQIALLAGALFHRGALVVGTRCARAFVVVLTILAAPFLLRALSAHARVALALVVLVAVLPRSLFVVAPWEVWRALGPHELGALLGRLLARKARRGTGDLWFDRNDVGLVAAARGHHRVVALIEPLHPVLHRPGRDVLARNQGAPTVT